VPAVESIERLGDGVVLHLAGELDLYNAGDVAAALDEVAGEGHQRVVVDLAAVEFVDSTALGALVEARKQIGGETLVLAAPRPDVSRALEISGLHKHFAVRDSVADALG
jgi:anti-anti-sigma factor